MNSNPHSNTARALTRLWMDAQPTVLSFICASIPQFCDAEDVLQNTAVAAAENFDQYDPARPFVAWAIGIARFRIADFYRTGKRDPCLLDEAAMEQVAQEYVEQHQRLDERRTALEECVEQLSPRARSLLEGRYVEDLQSPELAARLGATRGSVRVMLTRIRTQLLKCIENKLAQGGIA